MMKFTKTNILISEKRKILRSRFENIIEIHTHNPIHGETQDFTPVGQAFIASV